MEEDGATIRSRTSSNGSTTARSPNLSLLDFETLEDFRGVLGDELDEEDFQHHRAVMDEIIEEARVRGIPVSQVTASVDEYRQWLAGQPERESGVETIQGFRRTSERPQAAGGRRLSAWPFSGLVVTAQVAPSRKLLTRDFGI